MTTTDCTWLINGFDLDQLSYGLLAATVWRGKISARRSTAVVPGRHGVVTTGMPPTWDEALVSITHAAQESSQADLEAAVNRLLTVLTQPELVLTRISGGIVASAKAELVSVDPGADFLAGSWAETVAVLAIPDVFFVEAAASSTVAFATDLVGAEITGLRGSSAPVVDAVVRLTGPHVGPLSLTDTGSGTGLAVADAGLAAGEYLFVDAADLRAWRSASADEWVPAGATLPVDYPARGPLQLWPAVEPSREPVAINLATAPSFEAVAASMVVRRNACPRPIATAGWNTTAGTGGTNAVSMPADARFKGGVVRRADWSVAGSGTITASPNANNVTAAVSGETWTHSVRYAVSGNGSAPTVRMTAITNTIVAQGTIDHGDGTFTAWRTVTYTAGGTGTIVLEFNGMSAGGWLLVGDAMSVKSPVQVAWFGGSYSPDPDLAAAWVGAANSSETTLTGAGVAATAMDLALAACISSTAWARSGSRSLRTIPLSPANTTYALIGGSTSGMTGYGITFIPGETYTIIATCRLAAPQTGSLAAGARRIRAYANTGAGNVLISTSEAAPNTAGEHELRLTVTVPLAATSFYVLLYAGSAAGGGDVWWDDPTIVRGIYVGPAFNPHRQPPEGMAVDWDGPADASSQTMYSIALGATVGVVRVHAAGGSGRTGATALTVRAGKAHF